MHNYEKAFAYLAEAYADRTLPEDECRWEIVGPPDCDQSIDEILDHFAETEAVMPGEVCDLLGLPERASYKDGALRIGEYTQRRSGSSGSPRATKRLRVTIIEAEPQHESEGVLYVQVPATWSETEVRSRLRDDLTELGDQAEWRVSHHEPDESYWIKDVEDVDDEDIGGGPIVRLN